MISHLRLINFRNYRDSVFEFGPLTIIVGSNGKGKTNILEALFFLSTGRSFRTAHDRELIRFGQPFARLISEPLDITLVAADRVQKNLRIHGKPQRLLHILGVQPTVLFTPSSLSLVDGGPAVRRQFMDILLSQTDTHYARSLLEYQRILKQRNELLHQIVNKSATSESLALWDDLLVQSSVAVIVTRKEMLRTLQESIDDLYHAISPSKEEHVQVAYASSVEKRQAAASEIELSTLFHERLRERKVAELQVGRTLIGPHRDDFHLLLNNKPVAEYGSRGQMRSVVMALKIFEYHHMKQQGEKSPTLLLDDVFSEFDQGRRKAVLRAVPEAQAIFTATDLKYVGRLPSRAEVIDIGKEQH